MDFVQFKTLSGSFWYLFCPKPILSVQNPTLAIFIHFCFMFNFTFFILQLIIGTTSLSSKLMFGSGNLGKIKQIIQSNVSISAIFIGVDIMTALQNSSLEHYFGVPVFDR